MENGTFQSRLAALQFTEDEELRPTHPWSSSADALLRQNEDLSARLKVTMQKLMQYEADLDQEHEANFRLNKTNQALQDQLLIWKEKQRLWLEQITQAELKAQSMEERFPEFQSLQSEVIRYRRYHEKVKTHIKPYIAQLKEYSNNLVTEIRELNRENLNKDHLLDKSSKRVDELQSELLLQLSAHTAAMEELKSIHLSEVKSLTSELSSMKESHIILEAKASRLDQTLNRQDELDNMVVVLKRHLEQAQQRIHSESEGLRGSLQMARNDLIKKSLEIESFEKNQIEIKADNARMSQDIQNLQDQLSSLRFLWKEKSEEGEKQKAIIASLEKLNLELSLKLKNSHL